MKSLFVLSLLLGGLLFMPQEELDYEIRGIVLDVVSNQPLSGVGVTVKGSTLKTETDLKGIFQLKIDVNKAILLFSQDLYFAKEVQWESGKYLRVNMRSMFSVEGEEEVTLDEVRVTEIKSRPARSAKMQMSVGYPGSHLHPQHTEPVTYNTEDYDHIDENTFRAVALHPTSTFSADVDKASYSNMRRFLQQGSQPPLDAVRIEELINYFNYEYPEPAGSDPLRIYQEVASCPWNPNHQLVQIGIKGRSMDVENLPASNLVFLIDVSGSMSAPNKLPLVKESFQLLLSQMRPFDRVAIVTYASNSGIHLPSTSAGEKGEILHSLSRLSAGGSTAGAAGIQTAYQLARENFIEGGNNRVILATDGDFNVGVSSDSELIRMIEQQRKSGIYLSALGFGMGNYKDNKMQKLAQHGNGNHHYIDQISEARKVFIHEFSGSLFTIADDVKIQVEFNPNQVAGYRLLGYENRMMQHEDFNKDEKDAGEVGAGHQVTALYEVVPVGVESELLGVSKELKYQKPAKVRPIYSNDLLTVQLRYKKPGEKSSKLIEEVIQAGESEWTSASTNFKWAAAVATFGMILRDSEFKGDADMNLVLRLAEESKSSDPFGYRNEFIQLVIGIGDVAWLE